jgi:hypothetical protein
MTDYDFHYCNIDNGHEKCQYKTKNKNKIRVHLRTKHNVYYCGDCRKRWNIKQEWKEHNTRKKKNTNQCTN